jgi:hypothetical protein
MADNIKVVPSAGVTDPPVATDDIGGIHYQKIKAGWGSDGTWQETTDTDGLRLPIGGAQIGLPTETAPSTDTGASGLNGRLQRLAQRLTTLDGHLTTLLTESFFQANNGQTTDLAAASDTATATVHGRLQRIAQRLTSLIALLPTALGASGGLKVDGSGTPLPVSGTVTANAGTNLNTSALVLEANDATRIGATNETPPGTDTLASGLNGRLQRLAVHLTTANAALAAALTQATFLTWVGLRREAVMTVTCLSGANLSNAFDTAGYGNWGLIVPGTFDGTVVRFDVCDTLGGTYLGLYDITGVRVELPQPVTIGRAYDVPGEVMAWRFIKLECATAQTGNTDFIVVLRS